MNDGDNHEWRVLVVEDEPDGQEVIAELLRYEKIETDRARTAEDALKILNEQSEIYTGILIDLALPGMNGIELLKAIRQEQRYAHLPCIAITAFHTTTVRHESLEAGFDAYFAKPLDDRTFAEELAKIIKAT